MRKTIYLVLAALTIVSCSKEQADSARTNNEIKFNVMLPSGNNVYQPSKVTTTSFENGDAISLYAVEYNGTEPMPLQVSGNYINNEKLTFNGTAWAGTRTLYWSDAACDFYALYPYQASVGSVEKHVFSVSTVQDELGYDASDLMYARAENVSRTSDGVQLRFNHIMSKLVVNVIRGPKFEGEIPDDIVAHIYNTNVDCTVDWVNGSVEKDAFGAKRTITMKKVSNSRFEAVVVPQNLEKKTPLVELTMGGIAYLLDYSLSFRAGYVHTITVTLNTSPDQEQISIDIDPGIDDWK